MIKYVSGDILLSKAEAIAHGVAPNDDFKQGLALSLREQWPAMYKDFRHYCTQRHPNEGSLWTWKGAGGPAIINLFTQQHPKTKNSHPGKATESYVNSTLKNIVKEVKSKNFKSIAITKVATGVGGLNWDSVKPLIEKHLSDIDATVYVYEEYVKNKEAQE